MQFLCRKGISVKYLAIASRLAPGVEPELQDEFRSPEQVTAGKATAGPGSGVWVSDVRLALVGVGGTIFWLRQEAENARKCADKAERNADRGQVERNQRDPEQARQAMRNRPSGFASSGPNDVGRSRTPTLRQGRASSGTNGGHPIPLFVVALLRSIEQVAQPQLALRRRSGQDHGHNS